MVTRALFIISLLFIVACSQVQEPLKSEDAGPEDVRPAPRGVSAADDAATRDESLEALESGRVVRVIDGDTIEVEIDSDVYTVRYIGVDTPETKHPTRGVEPYGLEVTEFNRELVEGKTVFMEKDVSEVDRFGRLLRYVWVNDVMVDAVLVAEGYARVATFPPDVRYGEDFVTFEGKAREEGRGLWRLRASGEVGGEVEDDGCDPAYPTVCIPSPPPDLNCADVPYRRFEVLAPDPHRFDGDRDGIGCER